MACKTFICQTINNLTGSYISLVNEEDFLKDPQKYIEKAYEKCQNIDNYDITKQKVIYARQ